MCQTLSEAWTSRRFNNRREPRSLPSLPPSYAIPRSYQRLCKPVTQRSEHKHPMAGSWSLPGYSPQMERGDLERAKSRCRQQRNSRDRHRCPFWLLKWERQFIGGGRSGEGVIVALLRGSSQKNRSIVSGTLSESFSLFLPTPSQPSLWCLVCSCGTQKSLCLQESTVQQNQLSGLE